MLTIAEPRSAAPSQKGKAQKGQKGQAKKATVPA